MSPAVQAERIRIRLNSQRACDCCQSTRNSTDDISRRLTCLANGSRKKSLRNRQHRKASKRKRRGHEDDEQPHAPMPPPRENRTCEQAAGSTQPHDTHHTSYANARTSDFRATVGIVDESSAKSVQKQRRLPLTAVSEPTASASWN